MVAGVVVEGMFVTVDADEEDEEDGQVEEEGREEDIEGFKDDEEVVEEDDEEVVEEDDDDDDDKDVDAGEDDDEKTEGFEVEDVLTTPIFSTVSPGTLLTSFKPIFFKFLFLSLIGLFFTFFENFEIFSISVKKSSSACFFSTETDGFETVSVL